MKKAYTFDDVALVPQFNNIPSRTIPSLETWLTTKTKVKTPLIPANMDTVICDELADKMIEYGSYPIFHRFCSFEKQLKWVKKYNNKCYISCGFNHYKEACELLKQGARGVCIDVAHGHCTRMLELIRKFKKDFPEKEIIAGNVCTALGYQDLVNAGANAVKVGIGPGAACKTRIVTGFGTPQFTALQECAHLAKKLKVPIISDGGIKCSKDLVLALAVGASTVMMGSLFSKTYESAADKYEKINNDYKLIVDKSHKNKNIYARYRGQASKDFQKDYYGSMKKGTVEEGIVIYTKCSGSVDDLMLDFCGGLRSGLTYGGAKNIKELQRKAEFVIVTATYKQESHPRKEQ